MAFLKLREEVFVSLTTEDIIKVIGIFLLIFIIIFILAVLTPKLAKICDKYIGRFIRKDENKQDENIYKVRSIYDAPEKKTLKENKNLDGEEKNGEE